MRQTAAHRPYVGSAGVLSRRGQSPVCHSAGHRLGFTLIEVMIALVIIGLAGLGLASFSMQSYRAVQNLTIRATAENLAEVTLEELGSMNVSKLSMMVQPSSASVDINFPENGYVEPVQEAWDAAALYNGPSAYDSTNHVFIFPSSGTYQYHVLCNGQLVLGTYDSFFPDTTTPGTVGLGEDGSSGAVVMSDGSDLFTSDAWESFVTRIDPELNDYSPGQVFFLNKRLVDYNVYNIYKYGLASGIYLEPINKSENDENATLGWSQAGLLVFASTAPHLYREITITDVSTAASSKIYDISVRVIWTFGGTRQLVEITGRKTDLG